MGFCGKLFNAILEYDTPKIVHIENKTIGAINRLIQLAVIIYIIVYAIVIKKGYQEFDDVVSGTNTKLKGTVYLNRTGEMGRLLDVADYVIPPQEQGAFFVMTNLIETEQHQGECPEDPGLSSCDPDDNKCKKGQSVTNGNGVETGNCIPSAGNETVYVCEIYAWCPVENDTTPKPALLRASKDFTVLIKNNILFPRHKTNNQRRNILSTANSTYLKHCKYDTENEYCPIFELGYIVNASEENYDEVAIKGAVFSIRIHWECNLDYDITTCKPDYSFSRLDRNTLIAPGYNFRYANYYKVNGSDFRTLYKAYGLRFFVQVTGRGGKFNFVPFLINIGSGLALLSIATIMCDIIMLYVFKKRKFYMKKKYKYVDDTNYEKLVGDSSAGYGSTVKQV